jgi:hypothetical protein
MDDKRRYARYKRQYIITYSLKDDPRKTFEVSGLLDISKGGLKFASYEDYPIDTIIIFQIKFPFNYPNATRIAGKVVGVYPVPHAKSCRISVRFFDVDTLAAEALDQMEHVNQKTKA